MLSKVEVVLALHGSCIMDVDDVVGLTSSPPPPSSIVPEVRDQDLVSRDRKPEVMGVAAADALLLPPLPPISAVVAAAADTGVAAALWDVVEVTPPLGIDAEIGGVGVMSVEDAMPDEEDPALELEF